MRTVMAADGTMLAELSEIWEDIRENHQKSRNSDYDPMLLNCAAWLAADPGGESAHLRTIGLTGPYEDDELSDAG
ncbi:hypothetical protein OG693_31265 [Streptomyces sp. NBC_01259]|uniref:hypothetical protein n=1 Tax=Streptomyces sp. NBC_01259 TaxID=2903800 RepID=UPI003251EBD3